MSDGGGFVTASSDEAPITGSGGPAAGCPVRSLAAGDVDLSHHGDTELAPGLVDLAVNVRHDPGPGWLTEPVRAALDDLARYPDPAPARGAVAARHGRSAPEALLTAGAAEAFVLLARALPVRRAVLVHPQFTEPEAALRAAGHRVDRVILPPPFVLAPELVPADADLVVIGNPTNPTSVLHPADTIAGLCRPGRVVVVDEAFADTVPGEPESLAGRRDLPGLVVIRSFTKTWGLAGLRIGYLLGAPDLVARCAAAQPLWPVSSPALAAALALAQPRAVAAERRIAEQLDADRRYLVGRLAAVGLPVVGVPRSRFVLVHRPGADRLRAALRTAGYAVRRGDTFPGLGADWLRVTVRDPGTTDRFVAALVALGGAR
ncbi:Rv2231c family pyridoxal phosphate-dependent protein CobC [Actinocatenispora thailandica]